MTEKTKWEIYLEKQQQIAENSIKNNSESDISENSTKPWDLLDPRVPRATEEVAAQRYEICKSCPELFQLTKQCRRCGCFMVLKTKLQPSTCPIGKW
jgi:hypothetical protein